MVLCFLGETGFYALAGLILAGWEGLTRWDAGGTGVGWRDRHYQGLKQECHHLLFRGGGRRAAGGGNWWLAPIASVLKGRGVFLSEQQNNTNRLHTNRNKHVVKNIINIYVRYNCTMAAQKS